MTRLLCRHRPKHTSDGVFRRWLADGCPPRPAPAPEREPIEHLIARLTGQPVEPVPDVVLIGHAPYVVPAPREPYGVREAYDDLISTATHSQENP